MRPLLDHVALVAVAAGLLLVLLAPVRVRAAVLAGVLAVMLWPRKPRRKVRR